MKIKSKEYLNESYDRYDLEVENNHNFIVQGVVVHNSNQSTCMLDGQLVIGSRNLNRQPPGTMNRVKMSWLERIKTFTFRDPYKMVFVENASMRSTDNFWYPSTIPGVVKLLRNLGADWKQVQLFGEVFGPVQGLNYGSPTNLQYRAFDLLVDGKYVGYDEFKSLCDRYEIPTCPLLYRGPYSFAAVKAAANGQTLINDAGHMREGCVVKCVNEFSHPKVGRAIFKFIGDEYYLATYGKNPPVDILEE